MSKHKKSQKHSIEILKLNKSIVDKDKMKEKLYRVNERQDYKIVECECGISIKESNIDVHRQTNKHILRMHVNS
jgi:hypothetical protein